MKKKIALALMMSAALPLTVYASGGAVSEHPWLDLVFKFINFAGLLAILYFALRKTVPQALKDRSESVARDLIHALEAKEAAEAKLAEYEARVANLEREAAKLKEEFKAEGEAQKIKIIKDAEQASETIKKNAEAAGEREVRRITEELRSEAVREALRLAEEILKKSYSAEDQKQALELTIKKIEGLH